MAAGEVQVFTAAPPQVSCCSITSVRAEEQRTTQRRVSLFSPLMAALLVCNCHYQREVKRHAQVSIQQVSEEHLNHLNHHQTCRSSECTDSHSLC